MLPKILLIVTEKIKNDEWCGMRLALVNFNFSINERSRNQKLPNM
jgi:hypothetical protein